MNISVGIMAYNEEANIGRLLKAVMTQEVKDGNINEIFVVSSGSMDRTDDIVREYESMDNRIKLIVQKKREGKASAINLFLEKATGDIIILESGDTLPVEGTFRNMVEPFRDLSVGMTGAHPVPVNSKETFVGYVVNLMWSLHHRIALETPKLGELVAFRNIVRSIPNDTAVDEASIEAIVTQAGYRLHYAGDAIVRNKGPENIRDFIKQRRRIAAGHKHLAMETRHEVSTSSPVKILRYLFKGHSHNPGEILWTLGAVSLEAIGRLLGYYDFYVKKKNPFVWDIAESTKRLD
ncbi:MAG: glycosyltransferase [Desulfatiglans sp.]|nr:glycosyltransferase [Desulfatiglans sp.]